MPQPTRILTPELCRYWRATVLALPRLPRHALLRQLYAHYGEQLFALVPEVRRGC